jgi:hypothetical protein
LRLSNVFVLPFHLLYPKKDVSYKAMSSAKDRRITARDWKAMHIPA